MRCLSPLGELLPILQNPTQKSFLLEELLHLSPAKLSLSLWVSTVCDSSAVPVLTTLYYNRLIYFCNYLSWKTMSPSKTGTGTIFYPFLCPHFSYIIGTQQKTLNSLQYPCKWPPGLSISFPSKPKVGQLCIDTIVPSLDSSSSWITSQSGFQKAWICSIMCL